MSDVSQALQHYKAVEEYLELKKIVNIHAKSMSFLQKLKILMDFHKKFCSVIKPFRIKKL